MKELNPNKKTISSIEIAELSGRSHKDVLKSIRAMESSWVKVCGRKFSLSSREQFMPNGGCKDIPCYELTYQECMYIAAKFNDEARAKLVLRWNALETGEEVPVYIIPKTSERSIVTAKQQCLIEDLQKQVVCQSEEIVELKKKSDYLELILSGPDTIKTTQIAQDYGMSAVAFNKALGVMKILRRINKQWVLYSEYLGKGYVQSKMHDIIRRDGRHSFILYTEWTQRGRLFLYEVLKAKGVLPLIER